MKSKINKVVGFCKKVAQIEKNWKLISRASLLVVSIVTFNLREEQLEKAVLVEHLKNEVKKLKKDLITYNRNFDEFPFPIWQKKKVGNQFVGQYFNPSYVRVFGHTFEKDVYNIIGKNNFELGFPTNIAQQFYENDIAVSVFGKTLRTTEKYTDEEGAEQKIRVVKWRVYQNKDTLVYGMVYEFLNKE